MNKKNNAKLGCNARHSSFQNSFPHQKQTSHNQMTNITRNKIDCTTHSELLAIGLLPLPVNPAGSDPVWVELEVVVELVVVAPPDSDETVIPAILRITAPSDGTVMVSLIVCSPEGPEVVRMFVVVYGADSRGSVRTSLMVCRPDGPDVVYARVVINELTGDMTTSLTVSTPDEPDVVYTSVVVNELRGDVTTELSVSRPDGPEVV